MSDPIYVLYAEDDSLDADLTCSRLEQNAPDIRLHVVGTADDCRQQLRDRHFDALLLDQHLPDAEGAQLLCELVREGLQQPVVMVTGAGDENLVITTLRLGASDYLPKSGDYLERLPAVLRGVVAEFRKKQDLGLALSPRRQRILYIEHSQMDIDLTLQYLAEAAPHLQLETVDTCREALRKLEEDPSYDLVLTDLRMTDLSALEFLREARVREMALPVIVVTGQGDEETAVAVLKLGVLDYIIKREGYLTRLPHAIEGALARFRLSQSHDALQAQLEALNRSLEQKVRERTAQLQHEIAERTRAEQQLEATLQQLHYLTGHIQSVQETERAYIAREVHDELGQSLTGLKMDAIWLKRHLSRTADALSPEEACRKLEAMTELIDATIQTVRRIVSELRPAILDTLGLVSALEWQAKDFQSRTDVPCDFIAAVEEVALERGASTAIFRIFQEALTNVARHAQAQHVEALLEEHEDGLLLEVRDDGIGITEDQVSNSTSFGLLGMKERAMLMGGTLTLEGAPGQGTIMRLHIPVKQQATQG